MTVKNVKGKAKYKKMTNKEILKKAIEKAVGGGWKENTAPLAFGAILEISNNKRLLKDFFRVNHHYSIIFSHSFAKAFWGEKRVNDEGEEVLWRKDGIETCLFAWEYRLQQMVLEKQPLKYLEKFL